VRQEFDKLDQNLTTSYDKQGCMMYVVASCSQAHHALSFKSFQLHAMTIIDVDNQLCFTAPAA
jgi:hypothetical protein